MVNIDLSAVTGLEEVDTGYLLGTIHILGVPHHFSMFEVTEDDDGVQRSAGNSITQSILDDYAEADNASGPYWTVMYGDKDYVIFITPFCR
jgi:hypothetical protein